MAKHRTGHLFKRGQTFYVRWAVDGRVFSKALYDSAGSPITNRREAEDAKVKLLAPFVVADQATALESIAAKLGGRRTELARLDDELHPPLTIGAAWADYVKTANRPDSGESTLRQYRFQFQSFVDWMGERHPEARTMREVTKEVAEEYASHLTTNKLSANTYNKHLNLLALVFRVLKGKARMVENPWLDMQRKRLTTHSRRELTFDELKTVCTSAGGELKTLLALGVYSGLRLGDCATLRWGEVDLVRNIIRRVPNKTARRNPKPVIVPIHRVLREMLAATPREARAEYVLPETAAAYLRRVHLVTDIVQAHFRKCGITLLKPGTGKKGKRAVLEIGFHSLRHTFVSLCRESGAPLAVVESIVGHSNPAMTRHYTHVGELAASQAVAALPTLIGDGTPTAAAKPGNQEKTLHEVLAIAVSMTGDDWAAKRDEIVRLLTAPEVPVEPPAATVDLE